MRTTEPRWTPIATLPLDAAVVKHHVGFRSPLSVRLRFWRDALLCRVRGFTFHYEDADGPFRASGWQDCRTHVCSIVRVSR